MRNNVYMDFDNLPREQVEKMVVEDFNTLGYTSQLRLKQLHHDIYDRLAEEATKQTEALIRQQNDYARNGYPAPVISDRALQRLRQARRAKMYGED